MKRPAARRAPDDRELPAVVPELRPREWRNRVEAIIFSAPEPVSREHLAQFVGAGASVDALVEEIRRDLRGGALDIVRVAGGWRYQTRPQYADVIAAAAPAALSGVELSAIERVVLTTIAYHQPVTRDEIVNLLRPQRFSRDILARLRQAELIGLGPRAPQPGSPHTYVTTPRFLDIHGLASIRDLPDFDRLAADGFLSKRDVLTGVFPDAPDVLGDTDRDDD